MTQPLSLALDEKEIQKVVKTVFVKIKTYIDREIKSELKRILLNKNIIFYLKEI